MFFFFGTWDNLTSYDVNVKTKKKLSQSDYPNDIYRKITLKHLELKS